MAFDLALLMRYRLTIARLGERDGFHWWESSALSDDGRYALGRLFRRTWHWASMELALEAARLKHAAMVPPGKQVNLFNLSTEIEAAFDRWFQQAKANNAAEIIILPAAPKTAEASVGQALAALEVPFQEVKPRAIGDRTIHVAQIEADQLQTNILQVIHMLLGGYLRSRKDQFLAPYITIR